VVLLPTELAEVFPFLVEEPGLVVVVVVADDPAAKLYALQKALL
jgi:hypothetical protein